MQRRIDQIRLKIERAKKHILDLDGAIGRFLRSEPYKISAKPHRIPELNHTTLYISEVMPIPDEIRLIIGDAIHNLRSSLDHLAWQLVEASGGKPNRDTFFPVIGGGPKSAQQYASAIGKGEIHKISPNALKVLNDIQPFNTHDQMLWFIHHLDIIDKHRLVITVAAHMDRWGVEVINRGTLSFEEGGWIPLQAGYEIVNIPTGTYQQPNQKFYLGTDIAFGETEIPKGELVIPMLTKMVDSVEIVVSKFESFLH